MLNRLKIVSLAIAATLISTTCFAQYGIRRGERWRLAFGLGASNVLSDLGGANRVGTHDSFRDFELPETRPAGYVGMVYTIKKNLKVKGEISYLRISGNDDLTQEPARRNRNLSFRSPLVSLNARIEYFFLDEHNGQLYRLHVRGVWGMHMNLYAFAGVGGTWFNPRGEYQGKWYSLQPLGTEGQGLGNGQKYSRITPIIPFGLGILYTINRNWNINMEFCMNKTFTDYLDDVSGNYFNKEKIGAARGAVAEHFADPTINLIPGGTDPGQERGDPSNKDTYMSITIGATCHINFRRRRYRAKF